tara:strand:+ start:334 stop:654 length:321 start_codon:yes stop_codon:yes gene_type:complete
MTEDFKNRLIDSMNKGGWGKENFTDAMPLINEHIQQLLIQRVVSSFFTASDVGKEFEILANTSGHGFHIGEIVTLLETNADPDDDEYKFAGKDDYWWCNFADIKTK